MLHIYCPHCGEYREEEEFHYAGEAHIARPADPNALSDAEWAEYLFMRKNVRGLHHEMWYHAAGCRKFFNATRHTVT
ncbi:sarcosine oxidase subunit delta [Oceanimonas sp. NS1]|nr:sarcosine oxidase subunit delta [Oceanimonas sp. NS1]